MTDRSFVNRHKIGPVTRAIDWILDQLGLWPATGLFLVENALLCALVIAIGGAWVRRTGDRRVAAPPDPPTAGEIAIVVITVVLNTGVTTAGLWLYRRGIVHFRRDVGWRALADVPILLVAMDFAMYFLHRLVHWKPLYFIHALHHRYDRPRPATLFVLSPAETLAFGALWLAVITIYSPSWLGMSIYLALNLAFGAIGHFGTEPLPRAWPRWPIVGLIATSTSHARHHQSKDHNFGFYTLIWDRLLGTTVPDYEEKFGRY
jgi:sterol desaturase/sphingolipid hydroxylase (fatty acid hydroxylase superfamily)